MASSNEAALRTEFTLALQRAGLRVTGDDEPGLWEQFLQARQYAQALDAWEARVKTTEPSVGFFPKVEA